VHIAIGIGHKGYADCLLTSSQHNLYDPYCPKQVESYSKNKFEKLVHLVGFIIRIDYIFHTPATRHCFEPARIIQDSLGTIHV